IRLKPTRRNDPAQGISGSAESSYHVRHIRESRLIEHVGSKLRTPTHLTTTDHLFVLWADSLDRLEKIRIRGHSSRQRIGSHDGYVDSARNMAAFEFCRGTHIKIDGVRVLLQSVIGLPGIDLFDAHGLQLY